MAKYKDCEICEKLIKDKHKSAKLWRLFCIVFIATTVIFAILYFSDGAFKTKTKITVEDTNIGNVVEGSGDISGDNNIVVGNGQVNGKVETKDHTPIIAISVIVGAVILVLGVGAIAIYIQKNTHYRN